MYSTELSAGIGVENENQVMGVYSANLRFKSSNNERFQYFESRVFTYNHTLHEIKTHSQYVHMYSLCTVGTGSNVTYTRISQNIAHS